MSDRILPDGWRWTQLGELASYINGRAFKPEDWETTGIPIIRIQNLTDKQAEFNYYSRAVEDRYIVEDGDLLISWSASLDAFIWDRGTAILNQHIFKAIENQRLITRRTCTMQCAKLCRKSVQRYMVQPCNTFAKANLRQFKSHYRHFRSNVVLLRPSMSKWRQSKRRA